MASQLTHAEVMRIAELARLEITPDEADTFARQLTAILDYAASVQSVRTDGIAERGASGDGDGVALPPLRDDRVQPGLDRATVGASAAETSADGALFRVPKVL
jgi:aspartyl-tRNA(Asn)/glutamyl-tRNA(Gln) amidotransferase subunit C